jgi:uncharacterized membrane protein
MNGKEIYNAKILGGIGSLLMVVPMIVGYAMLLSTIGIIMLFISLWKFGEIFQDKQIFNNFLKGFLIGFIGLVIGIFIGGFGILGSAMHYFSPHFSWHPFPLSLSIGLGMLIFYVLNILHFYFYKKSFELLGMYANHKLFSLAGLIMFVSSFLVILFGIGFLGISLGWILITVAFFTLKEELLANNSAVSE